MYNENYNPEYDNYNPNYYTESNVDPIRHACVVSKETSIQIINRGIVSSYQHIPSKWVRFTRSSIKVQLRQFPTLNTIIINTVNMDVEQSDESHFTMTSRDFDVTIKLVFH